MGAPSTPDVALYQVSRAAIRKAGARLSLEKRE